MLQKPIWDVENKTHFNESILMVQFQEQNKVWNLIYDEKLTTIYSAEILNISKARSPYFFLFFLQQVCMLPVKFHKPFHVTSYHIKRVKRVFDSRFC